MAKLILQFKGTTLKEIPIDKSHLSIGRDQSNDIVIDNLAISRHHAKIFHYSDQYFFIEDLNSANGVFVNTHRVTKEVLSHNDEILVGKHTLVFMNPDKEPVEQSEMGAASLVEQTVILGPALGAGTPSALAEQLSGLEGGIAVMSGGNEQERIILSKRLTVGGKSPMADIKLRGMFVGHPAFIISKRPDGFFITHSKGRRMTRVNGAVVDGQRELRDGDIITVGATTMQFYDAWQVWDEEAPEKDTRQAQRLPETCAVFAGQQE
jgi:pSer/pThr/pTyr-binding forkhead associated (FHA) protein